MEAVQLKNEQLEVTVNIHGAELRSVVDAKTGTEYMWNADATFWGRTSPVLFPFVGSVKNQKYTYEGQEYAMGQHGFARDMDFVLMEQTEDTLWFGLDSNKETYEKYPFHFRLEIGYQLKDRTLSVLWRVKNTDTKELHFSIGAHPAFFCPIIEGQKQSEYYLAFADENNKPKEVLINTVFGQGGLVTNEKKEYKLENGLLPIDEHLFDGDALVIENNQIKRVALLTPDKREYLVVEFDAPLAGIWSPPKKNAPFVCIEPWYGRCDSESFEGDLTQREWGNVLGINEEFNSKYKISFS